MRSSFQRISPLCFFVKDGMMKIRTASLMMDKCLLIEFGLIRSGGPAADVCVCVAVCGCVWVGVCVGGCVWVCVEGSSSPPACLDVVFSFVLFVGFG